MSTDPTGAPGAADAGSGQPSEEELRAAYEAELSRITSADMMLQSAVSLLNIASHRLAPRAPASAGEQAASPPPERDLEQVRDAIDGVRALLEILERRMPRELGPLRDALSQLQIAYAREAGNGVAEGGPEAPGAAAKPQDAATGGEQAAAEEPQDRNDQDASRPGPAEASGRLWVPGR